MSQPPPPNSAPPPQSTLHEVRTAQKSAAHLLPTLSSLSASNPHLKLLDVGSGSGTISTSFAKLLPQGQVTGIDLNASILPRARANAEKAGVENIEFKEGSIFKLPFEDESFDVCFCHQVLIHIPNPWEGLREMLRVTRKGGVVAAREGDYESECFWPDLEGLGKFHGLMGGVMRAGGGEPRAGRMLGGWALKAGAERSQVRVSFGAQSYCTEGERKVLCEFRCDVLIWVGANGCVVLAKGLVEQLRGGGLSAKALKFGLCSEDEFEKMAKAWEEWAERDDATLASLNGEILIHK